MENHECIKGTIELSTINYSYGTIDFFYDIAKQLCQIMQAEPDDTFLQVGCLKICIKAKNLAIFHKINCFEEEISNFYF